MTFQPIIPMIWTHALQSSIDFYVDNLGFTCGNRNDDSGWAALHRDGCELMIAKPNEHTPFDKPGFTGTFYIKLDDVDSLWTELKDKVRVCCEIETFDWGMREFA